MSPDIRPGVRVTVVSFGGLVRQGCHPVHYGSGLELEGAVGVVDRIDPRFRGREVIVASPTVTVPPFGSAWADCFGASELAVIGD